MIRRALVAVSCTVLLTASAVTACSDDDGDSGGGKTASTTQPDNSPTQGPQSGTDPAGSDPAPGSAPAE